MIHSTIWALEPLAFDTVNNLGFEAPQMQYNHHFLGVELLQGPPLLECFTALLLLLPSGALGLWTTAPVPERAKY